MARDATARLYDVATSKVVLKRRFDREEYDIGEVVFVAKKDRLINLDKLRESIQATRLSGGTKSGVLHLTVTVEGQVFPGEEELTMLPSGSDEVFQLENVSEENAKTGERPSSTNCVKRSTKVKRSLRLRDVLSAGRERGQVF